jgi:hypothetical protein
VVKKHGGVKHVKAARTEYNALKRSNPGATMTKLKTLACSKAVRRAYRKKHGIKTKPKSKK